MLRKTKNKIVIPLLVLLSFLPFQNCGQSYESLNGEAQVQSSCEGTDCAPLPDVTAPPTASKNSCLFNTMKILHDGVVTAFQSTRVTFGQTCKQEQRKCNDGVLDGSYTKLSCTVDAPPQPPPPLPPPTPAPTPQPPPSPTGSKCEDYPHDRKIPIATVAELKGIPARAIAGDLFVIAAGTYALDSVVFENLKGTNTKMITICGDGVVKIVGPGARSGKRILTIKNSQYVRVAQLDFSLGMKGLMMEGTNYSRFEKLSIHDVGHEAFHLMLWSHHNVVENSRFYNTGQEPGSEGIGEGVYVGSSLNKGIEDASDYNEILNNQFGPGITAEHIDIKEFTSRGLIEGNQFDGRGITQANSAESWVNIKGNYHTIKNNTGKNTPVRGFKQIVLTPGQGNFNVFENNSGELNNSSPDRMLIYLHRESTDAPNNQVYCNNKVLDQAAQYMTNAKKCIQP